MGLDMFLMRAKRLGGASIKQIRKLDNYFYYKYRSGHSDDMSYSEWAGERQPAQGLIDLYESECIDRYAYYDDDHKYPHRSIIETVGYWRKANAVHAWFVDKVQNGEDDCDTYEVTQEDLEELRDICQTILSSIKLVKGEINDGYYFDEYGNKVYNKIEGAYVENPEICEELLPSRSGFFFGSIDYDEWYVEDLKETVKIIDLVIESTDFDTDVVMYSSSW